MGCNTHVYIRWSSIWSLVFRALRGVSSMIVLMQGAQSGGRRHSHRLSTLELAPVLRFVRLFVYEKGRVHKPPWRKGGKPRGSPDGGRGLVETPAPPLCASFRFSF